MPREIKFRAWDKNLKKFRYEPLAISGNRAGDWILFPRENDSPYPQQRFVIMQFIGLKDKNGKEIYEGDILKSVHPTVKTFKEVKWSIYKYNIMQGDTWEVIGNIYENPELSKG